MNCPVKKILFLILLISSFSACEAYAVNPIDSTASAKPTEKTYQIQPTGQATDTASTSTVNLSASSSANILILRLKAAGVRLENISGRITARLQRMNLLAAPKGKTSSKVKQLQTQHNTLNQQIEKLKKDTAKLEETYQTAIEGKNTYQAWRKQVLNADYLLNQILTTEKNIIKSAKQIGPVASISATITATPKISVIK